MYNLKIYNLILLIILIIIIYIQYNTIETFDNYNSIPTFSTINPSYELPKIVWCYWDKDTLPPLIEQIQNNNKKKLIGWHIRIITETNKKEYVIEDCPNKSSISVTHYSDWLRLYLLKNYGGLWMDISIIINDANQINLLWYKTIMGNYELSGFNSQFLESDTTDIPVIENWFIMAPKGSEIISLWHDEYMYALKIGFYNYKMEKIKEGYNFQKIHDIKHESSNFQFIYNIFNDIQTHLNVYLTQHGCLLVVLQKNKEKISRLLYSNAKDTMFKIQDHCNWEEKCLKEKILDTSYSKKIPYIKLRGCDRIGLDLTDYFKTD